MCSECPGSTNEVFCGSKVLTVLTFVTNLNVTYKSFTICNVTGCSLTDEGTALCVCTVMCMSSAVGKLCCMC